MINYSIIRAALIFIFILPAYFFLTGCSNNCSSTTGKLTPEERSWISYSGGEQLIFSDTAANIDTLHVREPSFGTSVGSTEYMPCEHPVESGSVEIVDFLNSFTLQIAVSHTDEWNHATEPCIRDEGSSNYFYFSHFNEQDGISIGNHNYDHVYIMSIDTTSIIYKRVWRIYYTKVDGIVKFEMTQGGGSWSKL